jgi:aspartyl/asparaginyl-tRNA synthetase
MKLSIRYFFLLGAIFFNLCWATGKTVILLYPVENGESIGSIEQLLPEKYQNSQLVGQLRKNPTPVQKEYLFQIAWTGLQDKTDLTKQVAFEKPLVSTFKTRQKTLKKGQSLPIVGNFEHLLKSAQKLETEKTDIQALKRKQFAKNPSEKARSVEVEVRIDLHANALARAQQNRVNTQLRVQE